MSIVDVSRFCYDTNMTELRILGRIRLDSARINTNKVRFSYDKQNNTGKYGTNQLRIHPKHLQIIYKSCTNERKFVAVLQ